MAQKDLNFLGTVVFFEGRRYQFLPKKTALIAQSGHYSYSQWFLARRKNNLVLKSNFGD